MFRCPKIGCGKEFPTDHQLRGHLGGAHGGNESKLSKIEHGTVNGYKKEARRGMKTCIRCKRAWAAYVRERAQKAGGRK